MKKLTIDEAIAVLGITPGGVGRRLQALGPSNWGAKTELFHQLVKDARKRVLRKWHPDVCKDPSALERTQQINRVADELLKLQVGPPPRPASRPMASWYSNTSATQTYTSTGSGWIRVQWGGW